MSLKNELKDLKSEIKRLSFMEKFFGVWCISIMIAAIIFLSWSIYDMTTNPEKYEQVAQERAVAEQEYNERHTYEIISVERFIHITTNQYGAVIDQKPAYSIWYKDPSKPCDVELIDGIEFPEYGIHKLKLGNSNKVVFNMDNSITIYLTEETMKGL